jgi:hypothetical protein
MGLTGMPPHDPAERNGGDARAVQCGTYLDHFEARAFQQTAEQRWTAINSDKVRHEPQPLQQGEATENYEPQ